MALITVWIPVVIYAVLVSREFFHTANSAVYLSTDDGVANISYALATEGQFGFLSSPVLTGMARHDGLFSYGPYYFYAGAALIWLFGYNLVVLRSIHLIAMLGIAAAGGFWFRRESAGAVGALLAVGLLMAFQRGQWPMVRPDSLVSVFAVGLVVSSGVAIRTGKERYWFLAGLAASCGAFTHLVAWALVPAAAIILGLAYLTDAQDDGGNWRWPSAIWGRLAAVVAGGAVGAIGFYASFGFRIQDQLRFLRDYQELTGSMSERADPGGSFRDLLVHHFERAYWYLPSPMAYVVWATLAVAPAVVVVLLVMWRPSAERRSALSMVGPPAVVWVAYLLSLGVYNNFHAGYAMLNQVMWLWNAAAIVSLAMSLLGRWPALQRATSVAAWLLALTFGVGMPTLFRQPLDYRLAAATLTPIDEYIDHVLEVIPARVPAWGTVEFGIEHPGRIQLVQFWDGIKILAVLAPDRRAHLSPDYLVWGHVENNVNTTEVLTANGAPTVSDERERLIGPFRLAEAFPDSRYALVSLTMGPPYGVTRVYARANGAPALDRPLVSAYDPSARQWNRALGNAIPVKVARVASATVRLGESPAQQAILTMRGELAPGSYLLRVGLSAEQPAGAAAIFVASATPDVPGNVAAQASTTDVSPRFVGEGAAYLVYQHVGGPFYVSQFGTTTPAMIDVEASPILRLTDYVVARRAALPEHSVPANQWVAAVPENAVTADPSARHVTVVGNSTLYGYQALGPTLAVEPGQRMRLRVPVTIAAGRGCLGVLDEREARWLLPPDQLLPEYEFTVNDSRTVRPVLADCSTATGGVVPLKATIGDGSYVRWSTSDELYADQLMREFSNAKKSP